MPCRRFTPPLVSRPRSYTSLINLALMLAHVADGLLVLWEFSDGGWRPKSAHEDNFRPAVERMQEEGLVQRRHLLRPGEVERAGRPPSEATEGPILFELTKEGRERVQDLQKPLPRPSRK